MIKINPKVLANTCQGLTFEFDYGTFFDCVTGNRELVYAHGFQVRIT